MDSEIELYIMRAEDEFLLALHDMKLSTDFKVKEHFGFEKNKTFFFSVISHAYIIQFSIQLKPIF